jgi:hypothetical protein
MIDSLGTRTASREQVHTYICTYIDGSAFRGQYCVLCKCFFVILTFTLFLISISVSLFFVSFRFICFLFFQCKEWRTGHQVNIEFCFAQKISFEIELKTTFIWFTHNGIKLKIPSSLKTDLFR